MANNYDATVKELLNKAEEALRQLGLAPVVQWLNVELPRAQNPRVDLLGWTASGELVHIELQSHNDPEMALRMAEYALAILRQYKQYPHQLVVFLGQGKLNMESGLTTRGFAFHYDLVDVRQLDGQKLLASRRLADNILAVFASLDNTREGIRRILLNIAKLEEGHRSEELRLLFAAAELRELHHTVSEEVCKMPIIHETSIDDKTFGPWIRKGLEEGRQEEVQEIALLLLEKRFGSVPVAIATRVAALTRAQAHQLILAAVDASSLEDLFPAVGGKG
jgi:predicted transposase YdaD